jgi:hypothetical protein
VATSDVIREEVLKIEVITTAIQKIIGSKPAMNTSCG